MKKDTEIGDLVQELIEKQFLESGFCLYIEIWPMNILSVLNCLSPVHNHQLYATILTHYTSKIN